MTAPFGSAGQTGLYCPGVIIKHQITTPEDLPGHGTFLVGSGWDVHRFASGRPP